MSVLDGLPTEAELRRSTRRAAVCGAVALLVSAALSTGYLASIEDADLPTLFLLLYVVWTLATISAATPLNRRLSALGKEEVLVAGTRRRRRRLRVALVLGGTSRLSQDDRRVCRDQARVAQARARHHLSSNTLQLGSLITITAALTAMDVSPRPLLWLMTTTLAALVVWSALVAWELRAARRFIAADRT